MKIKLNIMGIIVFLLSLYLGVLGKVDWWVIFLIWLSRIELKVKLK